MRKVKQCKKRNYKGISTIWIIGIIVFILFSLLPIYIMLKYSISDKASIITGGKYPEPLWPFHPNFTMYHAILSRSDFQQAFFVSIKIALLTVMFSMILGAPAAYAITRYKLPGKSIILFLFISIRFFPDIASVVPLTTQFMKSPFIYLTPTMRVSLVHTLLGLPYVLYIAKGIFETIPIDLDEQVEIMGAGKFYGFFHIILPLAVPGLAAAAIYVFLLSWNEFTFSYFLMFQSPSATLSVYLQKLLLWTPQTNYLSAIAALVSLPVIIFTLIIQKYMVSGITDGAIK